MSLIKDTLLGWYTILCKQEKENVDWGKFWGEVSDLGEVTVKWYDTIAWHFIHTLAVVVIIALASEILIFLISCLRFNEFHGLRELGLEFHEFNKKIWKVLDPAKETE